MYSKSKRKDKDHLTLILLLYKVEKLFGCVKMLNETQKTSTYLPRTLHIKAAIKCNNHMNFDFFLFPIILCQTMMLRIKKNNMPIILIFTQMIIECSGNMLYNSFIYMNLITKISFSFQLQLLQLMRMWWVCFKYICLRFFFR